MPSYNCQALSCALQGVGFFHVRALRVTSSTSYAHNTAAPEFNCPAALQPDEDLKVEDVVPDIEMPTPHEIAETEELRRSVRDALSELPRDERRALTLRHIVGLRGTELANSLRKPEDEVRLLLDCSQTHIWQKLVASGCSLMTNGRAPGINPVL